MLLHLVSSVFPTLVVWGIVYNFMIKRKKIQVRNLAALAHILVITAIYAFLLLPDSQIDKADMDEAAKAIAAANKFGKFLLLIPLSIFSCAILRSGEQKNPGISGVAREKNAHISGVGGWLGFLIFSLMILGPLGGMGKLFNEFRNVVEQFPHLANDAQWQNYKQVSWLIFTVLASIQFAAGYRLWKTHLPQSVNFAIFSIWLTGPLGNALYIISGVVILGSNDDGNVIVQLAGIMTASVIFAIIWTAYLMRSIRVKNTYKLPQPNVSTLLKGSEVDHFNESVVQDKQEARFMQAFCMFDPFRCTSKFKQRLSASLMIVSLLSWCVFVLVRTAPYKGKLEMSDWLIIFAIPTAAYLVPFIGVTSLRKASKSEARYLLSASILWTFSVVSWAYIENWGYDFDFGIYFAVIALPLIGAWLAIFLWKWSKAS